MLNDSGNMARAAARTAQPYRRYLIGLPLQRSLFAQAARAATMISWPGLASESDFPARLDENGDLFLDRSQVGALARELSSSLTPENLEFMLETHAAACAALVNASENAARVAASSSKTLNELTDALADRMAVVLAYGVLSKFVPDILLRALADSGDIAPPPFPEKSAGAELMQETFALYEACAARSYNPQRLREHWPDVSPEVIQLVKDFCKRQTGFGPLAWDSPGYEDPSYVIRLLHSAFDGVDTKQVTRRIALAERPTLTRSSSKAGARVVALRRVLGFWLEFLERETWYVRRAFYIGMVPLLQQVAAEHKKELPALQPAHLLFLEIGELAAGVIEFTAIQTRQDRYLQNAEYLSLHGIGPERLASMIATL